MRRFNVVIENTKFELEVEEYKQIPLIISTGNHQAWIEAGHREVMHSAHKKM